MKIPEPEAKPQDMAIIKLAIALDRSAVLVDSDIIVLVTVKIPAIDGAWSEAIKIFSLIPSESNHWTLNSYQRLCGKHIHCKEACIFFISNLHTPSHSELLLDFYLNCSRWDQNSARRIQSQISLRLLSKSIRTSH